MIQPGVKWFEWLRGIRSSTGLLLLLAIIAIMQGCSTAAGNIATMPMTPAIRPEIPATNIAPPGAAPVDKTVPSKSAAVHVGDASWYGPGFTGKTTASGDLFDETKMTAAHKTLPLGTKAKVTNIKDGKSVEVEINDRGPYAEGRIIDLSQAAARALGIIDRGVVKVRIEPLEDQVSSGDSQ